MLTACLNGDRAAHLGVPTTPAEVAAEALAAVRAGADDLHVHPRADSGAESLDVGVQARTLAAVREVVPGVPVGVSTHAGIVGDAVVRQRLVQAWAGPHDGGPDVASVNWHEEGAERLAGTLVSRGIGVEAGLFTPTAAARFASGPWPQQVVRVLVEAIPGTTPGAEGPWAAQRILAALGRPVGPVLVHGEERWAWPVLRWALAHGHDARIGLEDTLRDEDGLRVFGNAALVRRAAAPSGRG